MSAHDHVPSDQVLIVAGFGRCGSSLVMQMLHAGGVPCIGDPPAFEPPSGETLIFDLTKDKLASFAGKAVKILDPQLATYDFFSEVPHMVIWLDRDPKQQAKSFVKFGRLVGGLPFTRSHIGPLAAGLIKDRPHAHQVLGLESCKHLFLRFENVIKHPHETAKQIADFLPWPFFHPTLAAGVVVGRNTDCLPGLLEAMLVTQ